MCFHSVSIHRNIACLPGSQLRSCYCCLKQHTQITHLHRARSQGGEINWYKVQSNIISDCDNCPDKKLKWWECNRMIVKESRGLCAVAGSTILEIIWAWPWGQDAMGIFTKLLVVSKISVGLMRPWSQGRREQYNSYTHPDSLEIKYQYPFQ